MSGFIERLRYCVDRIFNNNVRIAALFDCHIGNREGLSGIGIGFVTRIKMHDLRTGGEINNIDDVFFGILLDGKRNGCLLTAVRNIAAVVLRDRRSTLTVVLPTAFSQYLTVTLEVVGFCLVSLISSSSIPPTLSISMQ